MKVLLDAKELRLEGTGLARYEREIASRVTATLPTVTVVTRRSLVDGSADLLGGRVIALPAWLPAIVMEQVVIPIIALCVRPSTFHALAGRLPSVLPRCRRVLTFHEDRQSYYAAHPPQRMYGRLARRWHERTEHQSLKKAHRVLAISHFAASQAAARSADGHGEVTVIPHGVSAEFRPRGLSRGRFVLAFCTEDPRDDMDYLFSALVRVDHQVGLAMVGGCGPRTQAIYREKASELGLEFRFHGRVPDAELAALFSSALCFVHTSTFEGFGLAVAEAMACGSPVIARPSPAVDEVAGEVAFSCRDSGEAAAAISRLVSEPGLVEARALAGVERMKRYRWENSANATMQAYV